MAIRFDANIRIARKGEPGAQIDSRSVTEAIVDAFPVIAARKLHRKVEVKDVATAQGSLLVTFVIVVFGGSEVVSRLKDLPEHLDAVADTLERSLRFVLAGAGFRRDGYDTDITIDPLDAPQATTRSVALMASAFAILVSLGVFAFLYDRQETASETTEQHMKTIEADIAALKLAQGIQAAKLDVVAAFAGRPLPAPAKAGKGP